MITRTRKKPHAPNHPEFAVVFGDPYRKPEPKLAPNHADAEPEVVDPGDPLFHDPNVQQ